ncbi:TPA: hypothetical protein ACH3X1_013461 [Trebouxia sp. C0004]
MEGTDLAEVPRLVCQAESLGRLRSAEKYNLVLMDESESILMQLSSEKTMGDRAGLVTAVLHDVLLKGEKVVFADAYMTNRTLNLVHQIFKARTEKVKVIYNSWCQEPHKAYRLDDKKEFVHELIKRLKSGKNCVAFCGTNKFADEMNKQVKKELPDLAILYYSGDTPCSVKEADLAKVKCRWLQCSLLLYTSTLTVGVSADIHELC